MYHGTSYTLFKELVNEGYARIIRLIEEDQDETRHLEYKVSQSDGSGSSSKDAEKIAQAITSFLNTDGGVLIMGIDKKDGSICRESPISNLATYMRSVVNSLSDLVSPSAAVDAEAIIKGDDTGFLAVHVSPGGAKPYMCLKDNRYYMRSEGRKIRMDEATVRAFAVAQASPDLELRIKKSRVIPISVNGMIGGLLAMNLAIYNRGLGIAEKVAIAFEKEKYESQRDIGRQTDFWSDTFTEQSVAFPGDADATSVLFMSKAELRVYPYMECNLATICGFRPTENIRFMLYSTGFTKQVTLKCDFSKEVVTIQQ